MDLKNYLLEYVSSGRNRRRSGMPVEPDTVLKKGDVVRIKDKEWFDGLKKDRWGWEKDCGIIEYEHTTVFFNRYMREWLGKEVEIIKSVRSSVDQVTRYIVRLPDNSNPDIENYRFTNEMLEYI